MSITLHWFLPTSGDGRNVVERFHANRAESSARRAPDIDYLAQVARAAEQLGFTGVLTPTGTFCEDAWLVTAALIRETRTLKFLVAFRPGVISPTLAAQMASTYQRVSRGRLLLNVVTGGDAVEQERFGDFHDHDSRYARTDEFLSIVRGAWSGEPFSYDGEHLKVVGATTLDAPDPIPAVYFGGSSDAALPVAAKHADVYLTWGEPPAQVAEKIARVRELAAAQGREPRFGVRLHTISRDTSEAAWAEAQRLLDALDPAQVAEAQAQLGKSQSVGQQRMLELHQGGLDKGVRGLEVHPNLWAGIGLVRGGAGTALVGSHTEVADLIEQYHDIGITEFVLSGYPHLEEAYWFGEGVRPELARRGLLAGQEAAQPSALRVAAS
ncbi:LLM class flavin-dependent oxidoreductase [Actinokineospora globicatena]|uniref:Alkanesulfonate monooxygenase n=1 Tax=Actinokineospora globicatena TaxID=103729 RepID=A0A9W6QPG9_9PSEU|nr:LLM class flavin-dependent oxidoreductase [Actinokineospora globicatena]MCP2301431.1 alkanesulfonate monooxygenase [Actinokineospora globicatena]GLW76930.1 alkanesulfonate monooxygenase [Actinokineospora globicatena]GLW83763.1 alkanesulfonate monooxygenase [Actinokineospora globicatena]GLW92294.1 alkanesulfonate monooxygenase [Actinokineospora globicatena]